jgi:hypothetical protein
VQWLLICFDFSFFSPVLCLSISECKFDVYDVCQCTLKKSTRVCAQLKSHAGNYNKGEMRFLGVLLVDSNKIHIVEFSS